LSIASPAEHGRAVVRHGSPPSPRGHATQEDVGVEGHPPPFAFGKEWGTRAFRHCLKQWHTHVVMVPLVSRAGQDCHSPNHRVPRPRRGRATQGSVPRCWKQRGTRVRRRHARAARLGQAEPADLGMTPTTLREDGPPDCRRLASQRIRHPGVSPPLLEATGHPRIIESPALREDGPPVKDRSCPREVRLYRIPKGGWNPPYALTQRMAHPQHGGACKQVARPTCRSVPQFADARPATQRLQRAPEFILICAFFFIPP